MVAVAAIDTLGTTLLNTDSVILLLVAVDVVWQALLAVSIQVTTSPLFKLASV